MLEQVSGVLGEDRSDGLQVVDRYEENVGWALAEMLVGPAQAAAAQQCYEYKNRG